MSEQTQRILVADDDSMVRTIMRDTLEKADNNFEVMIAQDGVAAFEIFVQSHFDLVITDLIMPRRGGVELVKAIRRQDTDTPIIVLSAFDFDDIQPKNLSLNIFRYLIKPLRINEIRQAVLDALKPKSHPSDDSDD